jgi:hypothetical protein
MDRKLTDYRTLIQTILQEHASQVNRSRRNGIQCITVFDEKQDHYFLHTIGWRDIERIWNTSLYVRLHNDKFYIEIAPNGLPTEEGIATELLAAGVPKEDIVLAFHHPSMRPYTEFAVT